MLAIYTILIYLPTIISANLLVAQFQFFPALHFHLYVDAATELRIFSKRSSFSHPAPLVYFRVHEMQSRPLQLPATVAYPSVETAENQRALTDFLHTGTPPLSTMYNLGLTLPEKHVLHSQWQQSFLQKGFLNQRIHKIAFFVMKPETCNCICLVSSFYDNQLFSCIHKYSLKRQSIIPLLNDYTIHQFPLSNKKTSSGNVYIKFSLRNRPKSTIPRRQISFPKPTPLPALRFVSRGFGHKPFGWGQLLSPG